MDKKRGPQFGVQKNASKSKVTLKWAVQVKMNGKLYTVLSFRITFGGASGLTYFCLFLDIVYDIINSMLAEEMDNTIYLSEIFLNYLYKFQSMKTVNLTFTLIFLLE